MNFSDLGVVKKLPLKKMEDGKLVKKKVGRPKKPNVEYVTIRINKTLHDKIKEYARSQDLNKSALFSIVMRDFLREKVEEE